MGGLPDECWGVVGMPFQCVEKQSYYFNLGLDAQVRATLESSGFHKTSSRGEPTPSTARAFRAAPSLPLRAGFQRTDHIDGLPLPLRNRRDDAHAGVPPATIAFSDHPKRQSGVRFNRESIAGPLAIQRSQLLRQRNARSRRGRTPQECRTMTIDDQHDLIGSSGRDCAFTAIGRSTCIGLPGHDHEMINSPAYIDHPLT